jgi:Arc/MetJ-type ribon-helix-helix transcriptional regulator
MAHQFSSDVDRLIRERMVAGGYRSEDDLLRDALAALAERADDLAAIEAGIDDLNAGRTIPLAAVDAKIRTDLGFSPRE